MSNPVKYSIAPLPYTIGRNNMNLGVGVTGYGSTPETNFWQGYEVTPSGYVIYINKAEQGPSIYSPESDLDLVGLISIDAFGGSSITTTSDALLWLYNQNNTICINMEYPSIPTEGLSMLLDAGFTASYPRTGNEWYDLSRNDNSGNIIGSTFSGLQKGNIIFDGSNDYVDINNGASVLSNNEYTKIIWFYVNSFSNANNLISGGSESGQGQHAFWLGATNKLQSGHNGSWNIVESSTTLNLNTWYCGAVTFSSVAGWKLYLNGVLEDSSPDNITFSGDGNIFIGCYDTGSNLFNGAISNAIIYDRVLSGSEIESMYNSFSPRFVIPTTTTTSTTSTTTTTTIAPTTTTTTSTTTTTTISPTTTTTSTTSTTTLAPTTTTTTTVVPGIVTNGLFMKLDASNYTSGTWTDETGNGNNATINGATWISTNGGIFDLDGTNDNIGIPHTANLSLNTSTQRTIQVWVKFDSIPGVNVQLPVFGKLSSGFGFDGYWGGLFSNTGTVRCVTNGTAVQKISTSTLTISANTWYLFTFISQITSTANTTKIYIDQTEYVTTSHGSDSYNETNPLYLGYIGSGVGSVYLDGKIGASYFYTRGLSAAEVLTNYNETKERYTNPVTSNLVLYYDPSNSASYTGSGTTITDLSGNGRNGTMSNIAFTSPYFTYNGTSSQISVADNALLEPGSGNWTMEVWARQTTSGNDVILGKFDNGGLSLDVSYSIRTTGTTFYAQIGSGSGSGSTLFVNSTSYTGTLNTWYQIVYVFKNGGTKTLETFINGTSIGTVNHNLSSILNTTNPLYIGSYNGGEFSQWFDGRIGITRLYNTALSSAQVLQNFNADKAKYGL